MQFVVVSISLVLFACAFGFYQLAKNLKKQNKVLENGEKTKYQIVPCVFGSVFVILGIWYIVLGVIK